MDLPRPPGDPEMKNIIDKLAQFVARNGHEFETMTKTKQKDNPKFSFLFGGEYYNYYMYKVHAEQTIQRQQQSGGGPPSGPAAPRPLMDIPTVPPPSWNQGPSPSGGFDGGGNGPWGGGGPPGFGGGVWGPHTPGGPNMNSGGPNMNPGSNNMNPGGPNMNPGGPNMAGMGPQGLMMDSGMGQGSPGRINRGNPGLLGMAPGSEAMSMGPGNPPGASSQPPPPPNISHLTEQIVPLQAQIDTLKSQISQSESNLSGQWEVLQQTQDSKIKEAVSAAQEEALQDLCSGTSISMEDMDSILQPIIDSCTKDSISAGKQWIFTHATSPNTNALIARYLCYRVTQDDAPFNTRLHVIYLINDVLHHCVRKNAEELKVALSSVVVTMYCSAAMVAAPDQMKKLEKLLTLWESKNKFFDNDTLDKMRNHGNSWDEYKKGIRNEYKVMVDDVIESTSKTYNSYKMQHDQFVSHANKTVDDLERQIKQMKQQVSDIEGQHQEAVRQWQQQQSPSQNSSQSSRRSRWDRTAAAWDGSSQPRFQPPPGIPVPDVSRPPPGFAPPQYGLVQEEKETIPTLPYFELPAGLMVPLVKLEDNEYKPIDPSLIRMPPPQPPNERLMAAVELFYAPPSHERPRDPEGWEKLGLYEWSREKQSAIRKKSDDIEKGIRDRSPTLSPERDFSRESTPEQTVPSQEKLIDKKKERKRYRSRSRTRSRTRSNSGSRESTPERRHTPPRSRKKDKRKERSRSRSRTRSRSRSRGSDYGNLPSFLTKRSPSPRRRSRSPSGGRGRSPSPVESRRRSLSPPVAGFQMGDSRLDGSNKGHQMLQKMGWKGAGLGSQESGRVDPVEGGDVREKQDQFKGVGINVNDPYENFRKSRAGAFYTRMRDKADERSDKRK